jgi:hypothetical protein
MLSYSGILARCRDEIIQSGDSTQSRYGDGQMENSRAARNAHAAQRRLSGRMLFEQRIWSDAPLQPRCGVHLAQCGSHPLIQQQDQTGGYIILARDIRPDCHGCTPYCCVLILVSPKDAWHHHPHRVPTLGRHARGMRHSHAASCHLRGHDPACPRYALPAFRYVWIDRSKTHTCVSVTPSNMRLHHSNDCYVLAPDMGWG